MTIAGHQLSAIIAQISIIDVGYDEEDETVIVNLLEATSTTFIPS